MTRNFTVVLLLAISTSHLYAQSWKQYYDSTQLFWAKDWNKTVALLQNAEQGAVNDLGIYDENYVTILNDLGVAYWRIKDYKNAEKLLNQSLHIKSEIYTNAHNAEVSSTMTNLAGLYADQGLWFKSRDLYKKIVFNEVPQPDPAVYFAAAQSLIGVYEKLNQTDSALLVWKHAESLQIPGVTDNRALYYEWVLTYARLNWKLRKYSEASVLLESVRDELAKNDATQSVLYIKTIRDLGMLNLETGQVTKAERDLLHAHQLTKTSHAGEELLTADVLNCLARVYEKLGIYDKAHGYYQESLNLYRLSYGLNSLPCITLKNNIAGIQLSKGDVAGAIKSYEDVLESYRQLIPESDPLFITALNNLANAHRRNDEYHHAYVYLRWANELVQKHHHGKDDLAATVVNNLAVLYTHKGDLESAAQHYEEAYEVKREIYGDHSVVLLDIVSNMALVYWALDDPEKAIPFFKKSLELTGKEIRYVFPNLNESEQAQFYKKLREDYERFNTIVIQWSAKYPELLVQMANNQLIIKSLFFLTHQHRNKVIAAKNDSVLIQELETLKVKREQLGNLYQLPLKEVQAMGISLKSLELEIDRMDKSISLAVSKGSADEALFRQHFTWSNIYDRLKPEEALVEMVRFRKFDIQHKKDRLTSAYRMSFGFTDSVYYAALITAKDLSGGPRLVVMRNGDGMEKRSLNYYRNALHFGVPDEYSYQAYWEPLEALLSERKKIYFAPDGVYHKISLNTLRDPYDDRYLIQQYDLHLLLNAVQFITKQDKPMAKTGEAVLIGDPNFDTEAAPATSPVSSAGSGFTALPGTQEEVLTIDKILRYHAWQTNVYLKNAASERNLKSIHAPSVLHLATHGFFSPALVKLNGEAKNDFLFHSGILLSGANKSLAKGAGGSSNDGIVTAYEVMNLDLSGTDLVVLSACETGLGRVEDGEGVYGLQRSFLQAGARNVMISLWRVDDRCTKDLMIKFYEYLSVGNPKRTALKLAQLDQLQATKNPAAWGAFVMIGVD